jgi:hypothetical protein
MGYKPPENFQPSDEVVKSTPPNLSAPTQEEEAEWVRTFVDLCRAHYAFLARFTLYLERPEQIAEAWAHFQTGFNPEQVARDLIEKPFIIDEQVKAITNELEDRLNSLGLFKHIWIVPVGSAINGGSRVRVGFDNRSLYKVEDVDYVFIYEEPEDIGVFSFNDRMEKISLEADKFFAEKPGLVECEYINMYYLHAPHIRDEREAEIQLMRWEKKVVEGRALEEMPDVGWVNKDSIFVYFTPNSEWGHTLDCMGAALRNICSKDYQRWERLVRALLFAWYDIHRIKEKHVGKPIRDEYNYQELDDKTTFVVDNSARMMAKHMRKFLERTNTSGKPIEW